MSNDYGWWDMALELQCPPAMHRTHSHASWLTIPRARHEQLTPHAIEQMKRRRIDLHQVELALCWGVELHRAGAVFFVLRGRDIPHELRTDPTIRRAEGTTVVLENGRISTVYRNRDIRHLLRKPKHTRRPRVGRLQAHQDHPHRAWRRAS